MWKTFREELARVGVHVLPEVPHLLPGYDAICCFVGVLHDVAVPPPVVDWTVVSEELARLVAHELEILAEVGFTAFGRALVFVRASGMRIVRVMHVGYRVVDAERNGATLAGFAQFLQNIATERSVGDFEIGVGGVPVVEAVDMLGREDDILHSGGDDRIKPRVCIELSRVEFGQVFAVFVARDGPTPDLLFVPAFDGVGTSVDEEAKAFLEEPVS